MGAPASQKGLKGKNTRLKQLSEQFWDLSRCSKNFGSEKNLQRGGGRFSAPTFVGFFSDPKLFRQLLKSQNCSDSCLSLVFFPFNPFWLAGAAKNYILGTLDLLKNLIIFLLTFFCYFWLCLMKVRKTCSGYFLNKNKCESAICSKQQIKTYADDTRPSVNPRCTMF